jgi:hypothetical protein
VSASQSLVLEREPTMTDVLVIAALVLMLGILAFLLLSRIVGPWREQTVLHRVAALLELRHQPNPVLGIPRSGRATGTYRGRACTIEMGKQVGVELHTRVVLSVDNPSSCSFDVIRRPVPRGASESGRVLEHYKVIRSTPLHLAQAVVDSGQLEAQSSHFPRQVQASGYHLSLNGSLLRLQHRPGRTYRGPIDQDVAGLQALLGALCDVADAFERSEMAHLSRVPAQARAR